MVDSGVANSWGSTERFTKPRKDSRRSPLQQGGSENELTMNANELRELAQDAVTKSQATADPKTSLSWLKLARDLNALASKQVGTPDDEDWQAPKRSDA